MASISSQSLFTRASTEFQIRKMQTIDPNKFTQSIIQMSDQQSRDKNYEKSIEWLRTYVASLQAKLNSLVEELNNIYDLMLTETMYKRADSENTARLVNRTRNAADAPQFDYDIPHSAGDSGKGFAPYDAYLQSYYYNPFFGSRAMDFNKYLDQTNPKDLDVARTYYENIGNTHHELGASAFGTIGYLWLWDVDRINASYATTMDRFMDSEGILHVPTYDPLVGQPGVIGDPTLDLKPNTPPYDENFESFTLGTAGIDELGIDGWFFGGDGTDNTPAPYHGWTIENPPGPANNVYGENSNIPAFASKVLMQNRNTNNAYAFGGNDNWDNYTFEGTIGKVNGDDDYTRIWVRHKGALDQHGYMVQVHWNTPTTVKIFKVDNGNMVERASVDIGEDLTVGNNGAHWLRMKIVANNNKIDVYTGELDRVPPESFNGNPSSEIDTPNPPAGYANVVSFTDNDDNYEDFLEGKIGLSSASQASWFDALRIRGLPPDSNLLQVNVTALQPNRGLSSTLKEGTRISLNTGGWPGFTAGEITYQNGPGYSFQQEELFLEVTGFDDNDNPQYKVVKADGSTPMMQVRGAMTTESILNENFDSVANGTLPSGWTQSSSHPGQVYWKVVDNYSQSASKSLHYGEADGHGFVTGSSPNDGTVITPSLDLSGADQVDISFWHSWETETQAPTSGYDLKYVDISSDGGATWTPLQDLYTGSPTQDWQQRTVVTLDGDAVNFTNNVQIRWRFDTGDGNYNDRRGWNVDNLVITKTVASVEEAERYIVDESGNIRDRFGTTGFSGDYGQLPGNTQQSNPNRRPDSPSANTGDDQSLYDYVPNVTLEDNEYDIVYTIPSDFIYYREKLNSRFVAGTPSGAVGTETSDWNIKEEDDMPSNRNRPNISFDPRGTNVLGRFDVNNDRVQIYNSDAAMFGNTLLTYVEQEASIYNTKKTNSYAVWDGISGADYVSNSNLEGDGFDDYAMTLNFENKDRNGVGILSAVKRLHVKVTGESTIQNKSTVEYDSVDMAGTTGYKPLGVEMTYGYKNNELQNGGTLANTTTDTVNLTFTDATHTENFNAVNSGTPVPPGWSYTGAVEGEAGYPNIRTGSQGASGPLTYTQTHTETFNAGSYTVISGSVDYQAGGFPDLKTGPLDGGSANSSIRTNASYSIDPDTTELRVTIDSACQTGGCSHATHVGSINYLRTMRVRWNDGTFTDVDLTSTVDLNSVASGPTTPTQDRTFTIPVPAGKTSATYEFIQTSNDMSHSYTHHWTIDNMRIEQGKPSVNSALSSIQSPAYSLDSATTQIRVNIDSACLTGGCGHASHGSPEYLRTMRVRWSDGSFTDVDLTTSNNVDVSNATGPAVPTTRRSFLVDLPSSGSATASVEFIQTTSDLGHGYIHDWTIDNLTIDEGRPTVLPDPNASLFTDAAGSATFKLHMNPDEAIVNDGTVRLDVSYAEDLNRDGKINNTAFSGVVTGRSYTIDPTTGAITSAIRTDFNYSGVREDSIVKIKTIGLDDLHADGGWSGTSKSLSNHTASMWVNGEHTGVDWSPYLGNHIQGENGNRLVFKKSYYNNTGAPVTLDIRTGVNAGAEFLLNGVQFANEWVTNNSPHTITLQPGKNDFEIRAWDDQQASSFVQLYTPIPRSGIDIKADETWQVSTSNGAATYDEADVVNRFEMNGNNVLYNEKTFNGYNKANEVYSNYLVVGDGRSGGATREDNSNRLTKRLKQVVDDPLFQEVFRFGLFSEMYIAATVSDNRGDQMVGKLILDWDWRRRRMEVKQGSFSAVFKA